MSRAITAVMLLLVLIIALLFWLLFNPPSPPTPPPPPPTPPSEPAPEPVSCSSTGFMRPMDFVGTWQRVKTPAPSGGMSTFNGRISFVNIDRTIVDDVLPSTWELAKPTTTQSCHPVLVIFGHQTDLQVFGSILTPFVPVDEADPDREYSEMMLLVPFVQRPALGDKMHTFVKRMFLNDMQAMTIGNQYYSYAKELGDFAESPVSMFVSESMVTAVAFSATASNPGTFQAFGTGTVPGFDEIREILEMPLVGVKPFGASWIDNCSYFELDYATFFHHHHELLDLFNIHK